MRNIAIIINKNWEAEPALAAMCSAEFRPISLPFPTVLISNQDKKFTSDKARAVFEIHESGDTSKPIILQAKVWCIQDLMDKSKSSSSSEEKYQVLTKMLNKESPELIIAVGTAGYYFDETSYAGSVVVGSRFFVHNGKTKNEPNPLTNLLLPEFETLLPQNVNPDLFTKLFPPHPLSMKPKIEPKMLRVPNNPTARATVLASQFYTAVGSVNITDYGEYAWVDAESVNAFRAVNQKLPIGSLETTHGVIRLSSLAPCIFVSAITDREGHFELEVNPGQNYVSSFNAGVVLAQMLADLGILIAQSPTFSFTP
ncbi:MAG: hypothetical protein JST27_04660 [Bacteroidetes bacterium]|nr:hypothetical protein [Bacteroidota bacterium]